ncbi:glycoside hydrolase family 2 TIM barrel-domain containing protein, partial [Candidatus Latescibacterota bacterium]
MKGEQNESVLERGFNDSTWEAIRLPHDWAIAGPFNPDADGSTGKLPWKGVGWYRKEFTLSAEHAEQQVYFDFDGIMAFPEIYINGKLAGTWDYGYVSFRIDATPYVKFGEQNVIAVKVDTRRHYSRWYPGAGIYRKVTMTMCSKIHIAHWGTYITTPEVNDESAQIEVLTSIENHHEEEMPVTVESILFDPSGVQVGSLTATKTVPANKSAEIKHTITVNNPKRWDILSPELYTAKTVIRNSGKLTDESETTFGIRTFRFTADDGFYLNGRRVQIQGVNLHHDHGPLGGVFNTRAMKRQLDIMREMGVNAIRTSHNPPAPELLELCDKMGLVVWDECFDKWERTADRINGEPLEEFGEKQIKNFLMRDRNHPSIVIWSIGNEIPNQPESPEGKSAERVKFMSEFVRKYDSTRPVGLSCCFPSTTEKPILDALDLTGWNYGRRYEQMREHYPNKPIIYSESA